MNHESTIAPDRLDAATEPREPPRVIREEPPAALPFTMGEAVMGNGIMGGCILGADPVAVVGAGIVGACVCGGAAASEG